MAKAASRIPAGIAKAIGFYARGLRDGSVASLRKAFRPQAIVCGYIGEEGFVKPVDFLYQYVREQKAAVRKAPPPAPEVRSVALHGRTATVILHERAYLGFDYDTSLQMIELKGRWWILAKLFDGTPARRRG
jgi:hypothetical protein